MSYPLRGAWGMGGGASLCKLPAGFRQRGRVAGLEQPVEGQDADAEDVDRVLADDRMARDAGLPAAHGALARGLAFERLLVDAAFACHDERGRPHPAVEAERVENERRTRHELGVPVRVEPPRQSTAGARERKAARVTRRLVGEIG